MNKRSRRLGLHRETLCQLEPEKLTVAAAASQTCSIRCKIESWCMCTVGTCAPSATC
jgi:hypothetical protein